MQLPSIAFLYDLFKQHPSVQTDTRKIKSGDLFFALKGPHFNGNNFALAALASGASYVIVDEPIADSEKQDAFILQVPDVLTTLQDLAKHHREQFSIPFIGITGSNGKTTSKELIAAVLSSHFITYTTKGNLNNHIGVPFTLLSIQADAQMAVIEMGANHLHEIASYCQYAKPNFGIITNCGKAHLEGFGSEEGVKKGKGELFDFIRSNNGTVFIMSDYDYLQNMSTGIKEIVRYGTSNASVEGIAIDNHGMLSVQSIKGFEGIINTQLVGDYNLPNVLAAITIGQYFKVPFDKIKSAIENYAPSNSRSQLVEWNNNKVILDAYNANPSSMKVAVENFAKIKDDNKIMLLGGMKEMGSDSEKEHEQLVNLIKQYSWKQVVLVGAEFKHCHAPYLYFENAAEAKTWLVAQQFSNCQLLIKGSRGIQMEQVIN